MNFAASKQVCWHWVTFPVAAKAKDYNVAADAMLSDVAHNDECMWRNLP